MKSVGLGKFILQFVRCIFQIVFVVFALIAAIAAMPQHGYGKHVQILLIEFSENYRILFENAFVCYLGGGYGGGHNNHGGYGGYGHGELKFG